MCLAPGARADEWDKKTILTFSGPVQIPGVTLAAGTYVFKLADLTGNRHVVQVFDKDEKKIYGTILAIPDEKLEPSDKPVVMFAERPARTPQAVKAWFYPGDTIGNEFVYPKSEATRIARETHQSVLSMEDNSNATTTDQQRRDAMRSASVSRVDESGATSADKTEKSPESQPVTTTAQSAQPTTAPAPRTTTAQATPQTTTGGEPAPAPTTAAPTTADVSRHRANQPVGTSGQADTSRTRLPKTASDMTLFQLFSVLALAGGFGVRGLRTRFVEE